MTVKNKTENVSDLLPMCRVLIDEGYYEVVRLSRKTIKFWDRRLDLTGKRTHSIRITFPTVDEADLVFDYYTKKGE
jgi:hypothetical protein